MAVPKKSNVSRKKRVFVFSLNFVNVCTKIHKDIKQVADGLVFNKVSVKVCPICFKNKL